MTVPTDTQSERTSYAPLADPALRPSPPVVSTSADGLTSMTAAHLGTQPRGVPDVLHTLTHTSADRLKTGRHDLSALANLAIVLGHDDRLPVTQVRSWPWRTVGHLKIRFPDGTTTFGTGTLIGDHHVLTAGHCVFSEHNHGWASSIQFTPARDGTPVPNEKYWATELLSVSAWTKGGDTNHDYGLFCINAAAGAQFGWMGLHATTDDRKLVGHEVTISGYPDDSASYRPYQHRNRIQNLTADLLEYDVDTTSGQSGAPVWSEFDPPFQECVVGVHTRPSTPDLNQGVRLSASVFEHLTSWIATR